MATIAELEAQIAALKAAEASKAEPARQVGDVWAERYEWRGQDWIAMYRRGVKPVPARWNFPACDLEAIIKIMMAT